MSDRSFVSCLILSAAILECAIAGCSIGDEEPSKFRRVGGPVQEGGGAESVKPHPLGPDMAKLVSAAQDSHRYRRRSRETGKTSRQPGRPRYPIWHAIALVAASGITGATRSAATATVVMPRHATGPRPGDHTNP